MRKLLIAVLAALFAAAAFAAEVGGVKLADKVVGGRAGARAERRGRFAPSAIFKVYVGSLYLPAKAGDLAGVLAKGPRRIQMNLLRDLSRRPARRRAERRPQGQQHRSRAGGGQGAAATSSRRS